jgi:hypothetical protein
VGEVVEARVMDPSKVNWLAVVAASFVSFAVGGLWYSPLLFHRVWLRESGLTSEETKRSPIRPLVTCFVAALVAATNLAFFLGPAATLSFGAFAGFAAGFGWVAASFATTYTFERRSTRLLAIDAGYHVVTLTLMGTLLDAGDA